MIANDNIYQQAVQYASLCYSVIPIRPMQPDADGKYCKAPAVKELKPHFEHIATKEELTKWFREEGHTNMALCTGEVSNIIVVDCDSEEAFKQVCALRIPKTPLCKTKRGYHLYFQHNAEHGFKNGVSAIPHVDIKTDGGYVICPPSQYADGTFTYKWLVDPWDNAPQEMPAALVEALKRKPEGGEPPPSGKAPAALEELLEKISGAPHGERNDTLNRCSFMAARFVASGVDKTSIRAKLVEAGMESGLSRHEAEQAVDSGLNAGINKLPTVDGGKLPSHMQLAKAVIAANPSVRHTTRGWMRYDGGIWTEVDDNSINSLIIFLLGETYGTNCRITMSQVGSIRGMVQCDPAIQVPPDKFDAQHDWLVFTNGCLNVDTDEFAPHRPDLYATVRFDYDYDPNATAPTWDNFMADRFPVDTSTFLQEFAGYAVTTDTSLETAAWLYGQRGGGKSTFIEGIRAALGARCGRFGLSELNRPFGLTQVVGKTLLYCSEQPSGDAPRLDVLNTLISGETVSVERKYHESYDYQPVGKILWAMNKLPEIDDADNGIFRRIKVVEVPALPDGQRNPQVKEAIKKEGPGILLWALAGLRRLKASGYRFTESAPVKAATESFAQSADTVAMFVEECCVRGNGPDYCVPSNQLHAEYNTWAEGCSCPKLTPQKLGTEWSRLGLKDCRINGGPRGWSGIRLKRTMGVGAQG